VAIIPSGAVYLGLERPDTFEVFVNDNRLEVDADCGWWCDRSVRKLPIDPAILRLGHNEISLQCQYREDHPGLEIVYLLGNFGVAIQETGLIVNAPPTSLQLGDWTVQGLPFYAGSVTYRVEIASTLQAGEHLFSAIPDYRGTAMRVLVNGIQAGYLAWPPWELEITELVKAQPACDLRIEVLGHRRNSHGPLHSPKPWLYWTGPTQFRESDDYWRTHYQLVPCGLMAAPVLVVKKEDVG